MSRHAELDRVDLEILRLLVGDGRISRRQIARELRMSTPAIGHRIERMEREGVIQGWGARIDPAKLGFPLFAYVGATSVQGANQTDVVAALRRLPDVESVHPVAGATDLMLKLRVRDIDHLRTSIYEGIQNITGIMRTETLISLREMEPKEFDRGLIERALESVPDRRREPE
jgi:DNA-binding Lrp family transcriptional regulator